MSRKIDFVNAVRIFTEAVGQTTQKFNVQQTALYTGLQLEEMAEKLEAILGGDSPIVQDLNELSSSFKKGFCDEFILNADREAMLDADIDLAWVAIGSAFSQGADVNGACAEVAVANLRKRRDCPACGGTGWRFEDNLHDDECEMCSGRGVVAERDENGKVKKPEGWTPPDLKPFVKVEEL